METANLIEGIIPIAAGAYALLVATKKISFQNNFEMKVWAEKNTKFFYICGPFLVVFGILKVFGIV